MAKEPRYFNFPVQLLQGFLEDSNSVLFNIFSYGLYKHTLKYDYQDEYWTKMKAAARYYSVSIGNVDKTYERGKELFESIPENSPHCGINLKIFWDYHDNYKTDFEKACLLAFLAIKSILGAKKYCKITNDFIVSRMDGKVKTCPLADISEKIKKYATEYQLKKIRNELELKWFLTCYSRRTRGFYVTFEMSLDDLAYVAEKNREKMRIAQLRKQEMAAFENALKRIRSDS